MTPRQTCPRPNGLGRNLRSKTRWFTGFCNSHQVSHFATFFIDARAEISVAESHFVFYLFRDTGVTSLPARTPRTGPAGSGTCSFHRIFRFLGATRAGGSLLGRERRDRASRPPRRRGEARPRTRGCRGGSGRDGTLTPRRCC